MKPETVSTHFSPSTLITRVTRDNLGFLTASEVAALASRNDSRLTQLLVRCGGCRFVAAAQDVPQIINALEAAGDYVRDVSLPAK